MKEKPKPEYLYIQKMYSHSIVSFSVLTSEQVSVKSPASKESKLNVFFKGFCNFRSIKFYTS